MLEGNVSSSSFEMIENVIIFFSSLTFVSDKRKLMYQIVKKKRKKKKKRKTQRKNTYAICKIFRFLHICKIDTHENQSLPNIKNIATCTETSTLQVK